MKGPKVPLLMATVALTAVILPGPAEATRQPVNEGGDTRACMTPDEWEAVGLNMRRGRVERIVDSPGRKADPDMIGYVEGLGDFVGGAHHPPKAQSEVRQWRLCDQPDSFFGLVEFRARHANPARDRVQSTLLSTGVNPSGEPRIDRGLVTPRCYESAVATGNSSRQPPPWAPLTYKGSGPYPEYCSNACRQSAYRRRKDRRCAARARSREEYRR